MKRLLTVLTALLLITGCSRAPEPPPAPLESSPGVPRRARRLDLTAMAIPKGCRESNPARADYRPWFALDGSMFWVWRVENGAPSVGWTDAGCGELVRAADRLDEPSVLDGFSHWTEVLAWHPGMR